jgi:flagellar hook-basal body complex protein FliE
MTLEAIGAITAVDMAAPLQAAWTPEPAVAQPAPGFGDWFVQQMGAVNDSIGVAEQDVRKLAAGEAQSLHEVMMHMEEAKLSLQLLAQVRNRLLDAYQEVMRMQV